MSLPLSDLIVASVSERTYNNYKRDGKKFAWWLKQSALNLTPESLLLYIKHAYNAGLSYQQVNNVRCFVALEEKAHLGKQDTSSSQAVKTALKGYSRLAPQETVRKPLREKHLHKILHTSLTNCTKLLFLLAYLFLLRTSEALGIFAGEGKITRTSAGWKVFLPKSKGDRLQMGTSAFFKADVINKDLECLLTRWMPLIREDNGTTGQVLNAKLHAALGREATFHGWRHGRASDLFDSGVLQERLQQLGRWKTREAMLVYLHGVKARKQ